MKIVNSSLLRTSLVSAAPTTACACTAVPLPVEICRNDKHHGTCMQLRSGLLLRAGLTVPRVKVADGFTVVLQRRWALTGRSYLVGVVSVAPGTCAYTRLNGCP